MGETLRSRAYGLLGDSEERSPLRTAVSVTILTAIAVGVLPPPPAVKLPMQTTGTGARHDGSCAIRRVAAQATARPARPIRGRRRPSSPYHHAGSSKGTLDLLASRQQPEQRLVAG